MTDSPSRMTFEEFTQSAMSVIDRALEAGRASENELMLNSRRNIVAAQKSSGIEGESKKLQRFRHGRWTASSHLRIRFVAEVPKASVGNTPGSLPQRQPTRTIPWI